MSNWDRYLYDWVDVGDSKVCPTCRSRAAEESKLFSQWGATPGDGQSECGGKCRCIFLPSAIIDFDATFEGGKTILMELEKSGVENPSLLTFEAQKFYKVDDLVNEYEIITSDWNLPLKFYELQGADEKIDLLNDLIYMINNRSVTPELEKSILIRNKWMNGKLEYKE